METNPTTDFQNFQLHRPLPNATAILVLGVIGIIGSCCYGVPGTICSIIALVLFSKDKKLYLANPELYTEASYKNCKTGKICAIIALSLSILFILLTIGFIAVVGVAALSDPEALKHALGQ